MQKPHKSILWWFIQLVCYTPSGSHMIAFREEKQKCKTLLRLVTFYICCSKILDYMHDYKQQQQYQYSQRDCTFPHLHEVSQATWGFYLLGTIRNTIHHCWSSRSYKITIMAQVELIGNSFEKHIKLEWYACVPSPRNPLPGYLQLCSVGNSLASWK